MIRTSLRRLLEDRLRKDDTQIREAFQVFHYCVGYFFLENCQIDI